jgi:hypothetical protein
MLSIAVTEEALMQSSIIDFVRFWTFPFQNFYQSFLTTKYGSIKEFKKGDEKAVIGITKNQTGLNQLGAAW